MNLVYWLACAAEAPAPPPVPAPAAVHEEVTMLGKVAGVKFVGDWTSPACGGRNYARNVHFDNDQHYAVIDLVLPCAAGGECTWSGMVGFQGLWEVKDQVIRVQEIGMAATAAGGPHPVKFQATDDGKLVENGCFYTQGLTIPPGYTEAQVRPEVVK